MLNEADYKKIVDELVDKGKMLSEVHSRANSLREVLRDHASKSVAHTMCVTCFDVKEGKIINVVGAFETMPEDPDEKANMFMQIGIDLTGKGLYPIVVGLTTEAWMSVAKKGEEINPRASQDPDRKEVVVISSTSIAGVTVGELFALEREENDTVQLGDPIVQSEDAQMVSNLAAEVFRGFVLATQKKGEQHGS